MGEPLMGLPDPLVAPQCQSETRFYKTHHQLTNHHIKAKSSVKHHDVFEEKENLWLFLASSLSLF